MRVVFYDKATGEIEPGTTMFALEEDMLANTSPTRGAWPAALDHRSMRIDVAVRQRPVARLALAPDDVSAPYLLDLSDVAGTTRIVDELGTTLDAPGGETVELPAGTYTVTPPFPWRQQTVVVA